MSELSFPQIAHDYLLIPLGILGMMFDENEKHPYLPCLVNDYVVHKTSPNWNTWSMSYDDARKLKKYITHNFTKDQKEYILRYKSHTSFNDISKRRIEYESQLRKKLLKYLNSDIKILCKLVNPHIKQSRIRIDNVCNFYSGEFLTDHAFVNAIDYFKQNINQIEPDTYVSALVTVYTYMSSFKDEYGLKTSEFQSNFGFKDMRGIEILSKEELSKFKTRYYRE